MKFEEIRTIVRDHFTGTKIEEDNEATPRAILIKKEALRKILIFLRDNEKCYFDMLSCLTAIDNGPESGSMEVAYNLSSLPFEHQLMIKVEINRENPEIDSVSDIWRTAEWHEREAFDLFGIKFTGNPDLRRILLPEDWEGYPLRKDYQLQEYYHGIKVEY